MTPKDLAKRLFPDDFREIRSGEEYRGDCPNCSMDATVEYGRKPGRVLLRCNNGHDGCDPAVILGRVGLAITDLFVTEQVQHASKLPSWNLPYVRRKIRGFSSSERGHGRHRETVVAELAYRLNNAIAAEFGVGEPVTMDAVERIWEIIYQQWRDASFAPDRRYMIPLAADRNFGRALSGRGRWVEKTSRGQILFALPAARDEPEPIQLLLSFPPTILGGDVGNIGAVLGRLLNPSLNITLHALFAMAYDQANREHRSADGSFWLTTGLVADMLGYSRQPGTGRIGADASKGLRRRLQALLGMSFEMRDRDTYQHGILFAPLGERRFIREPHRAGRDSEVLYVIHPEIRRLDNFHVLRVDDLRAGPGTRQEDHAEAFRVYSAVKGLMRFKGVDRGQWAIETILDHSGAIASRRDYQAARTLWHRLNYLRDRGMFLECREATLRKGDRAVFLRLREEEGDRIIGLRKKAQARKVAASAGGAR